MFVRLRKVKSRLLNREYLSWITSRSLHIVYKNKKLKLLLKKLGSIHDNIQLQSVHDQIDRFDD